MLRIIHVSLFSVESLAYWRPRSCHPSACVARRSRYGGVYTNWLRARSGGAAQSELAALRQNARLGKQAAGTHQGEPTRFSPVGYGPVFSYRPCRSSEPTEEPAHEDNPPERSHLLDRP